MELISSYADAAYKFSKARKPESGKPLGKSWRMYKDGNEFVFNHYATQVARITLANHLIIYKSPHIAPLVYGTIHTVLPVSLVVVSKDNIRLHLHNLTNDNGYRAYGLTSYAEFRTKGSALMEGETAVDLGTMTLVNYKEPKRVVNPDARKTWLKQSGAFRKHLETMAKLGFFAAQYEKMDGFRYAFMSMRHVHTRRDIDLLVQGLAGDITTELLTRIAESMYREFYRTPTVPEQIKYIGDIMKTNSLTLRKALGVVSYE